MSSRCLTVGGEGFTISVGPHSPVQPSPAHDVLAQTGAGERPWVARAMVWVGEGPLEVPRCRTTDLSK